MAIIVGKKDGSFEKVKSGNTVAVNETGALVVLSDGYVVAAYASGTWNDALTESDYEPVNWAGKPIPS